MSEHLLLKQALSFHQNGDLNHAEKLYNAILRTNPRNSEALHFLGILAQQLGLLDRAIELVKQASSINPKRIDYQISLGKLYRSNGNLDLAVKCFKKIFRLGENQTEVLLNLGAVYLDSGKSKEALPLFRKLAKLDKNSASAYYHIGLACSRMNKMEEAKRSYLKALTLKPDYEDACNNLGLLLEKDSLRSQSIHLIIEYLNKNDSSKLKILLANLYQREEDFENAILCYTEELEAGNKSLEVLINLSGCLKNTGDWFQAEKLLLDACANYTESLEPFLNLGIFYIDSKRFEEAVEVLKKGLCVSQSILVLKSLGSAYFKLMEFDQSISAYKKILLIDPINVDALRGLSLVYHEQLDLVAAESNLQLALNLNPMNPEVHSSYAFLKLQREDYLEGFKEYEWRFKCEGFTSSLDHLNSKKWEGEEIFDKVLFIASEQGFGDILQFLRFIPQLKKVGVKKVIVEVQESLLPLVSLQESVDEWVIKGNTIPSYDVYCPLMSLPYCLKTNSKNVPSTTPIQLDLSRKISLPQQEGNGLKVGIVWAGNPIQVNDANRSMNLVEMDYLFQQKGILFYSLQIGNREIDIKNNKLEKRIYSLAPNIKDFHDSAILMEQLDLVITVCTSTAHLAGFLGIPCWTLLCFNPDWRWGLKRKDSLWYPNTRLFRQNKPRDWTSVIEEVVSELKKLKG